MEQERAVGQPRGDERDWSDVRFQRHLDAVKGLHRGPVVVVDSTGSTNLDVADQAAEGAPAGFAVIAHEQVNGHGRLGRRWVSPRGAGVSISILLRPDVPVSLWGWLPLIVGLAVVDACADVGLSAALKWPNDVIVVGQGPDGRPGPRKLGGILMERIESSSGEHRAAAVVGIGVNVDLTVDELPIETATSMRLEGLVVEREQLAVRILDRVVELAGVWEAAEGDVVGAGLMDRYRLTCSTIGQSVRVERPGGEILSGRALDVDRSGGLAIQTPDDREVVVTAGDVIHLRGS